MPEETNMAPPGIGGGALLGSHCDFFRPSSVFRPIGAAISSLVGPWFGDEIVSGTRKGHRLSRATLPGPSCSSREATVCGLVSEGDGPLFAAQDDLISLAGRMRFAGCRLPSLISLTEKEANAKVAAASSNVMEAFNEYAIAMEDRVEVSRNDKEIKSIGSEIKRLSAELEVAKHEGKRDAKKIEALTDAFVLHDEYQQAGT
ncbi:hypothetical protein DY000_02031503 [Brassica cretica]|uniref:Uncharacterized protein n=1 Tax=Brassica cretica TaxID=69181 RepID=A0ABQ7DTY4_BRACR|nr:hypothetical protein DY000_02031503 [Brassica cretica]